MYKTRTELWLSYSHEILSSDNCILRSYAY
jgi:hypothetical protein